MSSFATFDKIFIHWLRRYGVTILRIALGIVFLWFGALKIFGASPVVDLVSKTYSFLPEPAFMTVLGLWEVLIGLGLLFKICLRWTLFLLWLQMAGTIFSFALAPSTFFQHGNIFLLTTEGEFVVKNFVLIAASLVIGGFEVHPHTKREV